MRTWTRTRRAGASVVAAVGLLVLSAGTGLAQVPPHEHFIVLPEPAAPERVQVAPDVCENPELYDAFLNFHENVHTGQAGTVAFDRETNPVDIASRRCPS
jgi:hypothetical protein